MEFQSISNNVVIMFQSYRKQGEESLLLASPIFQDDEIKNQSRLNVTDNNQF